MSFNDKHPNHQRSLSMSTLEKKKVITSTDNINFNDDIVQVKHHNNSLIEISNNEGVLIETSREEEDKIQNISHLSDSVFEGSDVSNSNNTSQHNQDRVVNISTISFDTIDNNNNHQHSNLYNRNEDDISTTNDNRVVNTEYKLNPRKKKNNIFNHQNANENKTYNPTTRIPNLNTTLERFLVFLALLRTEYIGTIRNAHIVSLIRSNHSI